MKTETRIKVLYSHICADLLHWELQESFRTPGHRTIILKYFRELRIMCAGMEDITLKTAFLYAYGIARESLYADPDFPQDKIDPVPHWIFTNLENYKFYKEFFSKYSLQRR